MATHPRPGRTAATPNRTSGLVQVFALITETPVWPCSAVISRRQRSTEEAILIEMPDGQVEDLVNSQNAKSLLQPLVYGAPNPNS